MNFCMKLATNLLLRNVKKSPQNVAISPMSLNAVAAMFAAGSSGPTLDGMLKFTESESLKKFKTDFSKSMSIANSCSSGGRKISFGNGVWVNQRFPLKSSYGQCLKDEFRTEAKTQDFNNRGEVANDIDSWAEQKTEGIIKSIISENEIDPLMAVIMANAHYFKGVWKTKFDPQFTEHGDFYLGNGDKVSDVPFMSYSEKGICCLPHGSFLEFDVVEIPYQKEENSAQSLSMQIILPHEKDGLQDLIWKFDVIPEFLSMPFELGEKEIDIFRIPKFKFSYTLGNVRFPFMEGEMEVGEMFQDDSVAGSVIRQKACIEVDEEGTEEAALTFLECHDYLPNYRTTTKFVADHPFMFIIKEDKSGSVLFSGAVLNPLLQE